MANRYWPKASPIGRRLQLRGTWMRVVGVMEDIKYRSLTQSRTPLLYVPLAQRRTPVVSLFVRTRRTASGSVSDIGPELAAAIHSIDPNAPPYEFVTLARAS